MSFVDKIEDVTIVDMFTKAVAVAVVAQASLYNSTSVLVVLLLLL